MWRYKTPLLYSFKLHCCKFNDVIIIISSTFLQLTYFNILLFNMVFIFCFRREEERSYSLNVTNNIAYI